MASLKEEFVNYLSSLKSVTQDKLALESSTCQIVALHHIHLLSPKSLGKDQGNKIQLRL